MTRRRKTIPPVPLAPRHRRTWRSLWRRCACGLSAPCVDSLILPPIPPFPPPRGPRTERRADQGEIPIPLWSEAPGRPRAQSPDAGEISVSQPPHPPGDTGDPKRTSASPGGVSLPDIDLTAHPRAELGAAIRPPGDHRGGSRASAKPRRWGRGRSPTASGQSGGGSAPIGCPGAVDHKAQPDRRCAIDGRVAFRAATPEDSNSTPDQQGSRIRPTSRSGCGRPDPQAGHPRPDRSCGPNTPLTREGGGMDARSANRGGRCHPTGGGHDRADRVTNLRPGASGAGRLETPEPSASGTGRLETPQRGASGTGRLETPEPGVSGAGNLGAPPIRGGTNIGGDEAPPLNASAAAGETGPRHVQVGGRPAMAYHRINLARW